MNTAPLTGRARPDRRPHSLPEWQAEGGYAALASARQQAPAQVIDTVAAAALNGRGGAGFPAALKWRFMPVPGTTPGEGPSYLIVNGDEMEPGAFKDRLFLEALPQLVLEGAMIAAHAMHIGEIIILVRDAYRIGIHAMEHAIAEVDAAGLTSRDLKIRVHASAGRYIVGEETALIEALEGKRAVPRKRPPFPAQSGLWGRPTTVNNVETIANIPGIIANGPDWFRGLSRTAEGGTKLFGVSGRVHKPQLIEAPMGTTARELIDRCGGVSGTGELLAFQPGGGASGFLGPEHLDLPLDFANVAEAGSMFGTGTLIVLDTGICPVGVIARHMRFYARESCGWCTPCREGLPWVAQIVDDLEAGTAKAADLDILHMTAAEAGPRGRSFCDLMGGAMGPLATGLHRFERQFAAHAVHGCRA